jgi:hypothetical protein
VHGDFVGGEADFAGRLVAEGAEGGEFGLDLVEAGGEGVEQAVAGGGGGDAAGGAGEQAEAELFFEAADGVAEGGWRDAELGGGAGEAALPGDGDEADQVVGNGGNAV